MATTKKIVSVGSKDEAKALLKDKGRELAAALRDAVPFGHGFMLILSSDNGVVFFTDSPRPEAIRTIKEVLAHLEGS